MANDVVAELDRYLVRYETVGFTEMVQRARDEIVALREMRDAHVRMLSASLDHEAAARDKALEEAARVCERSAEMSCAAAIRALKDKP